MWCGIGPRLSKNLQSRFHPLSRAKQQIARLGDGLPQQEAVPVGPDVAQTFVRRRAGTIVRVRRRREPPLVDTAAMSAERVQIVRVKPQTTARNHERPRYPGRFESEDACSRVERLLDLRSLHD
jgi:hypothetical protein